MARPTKGNITNNSATVSATTHNVTHNHNTGDDGVLFAVAICKGNTVGFNLAAKYNGVSRERFMEKPDPDLIWTKKPLKDWTLYIQSKNHLGRYNVIAKRFILKREVIQFWAVYNELFTTPYYTVKTNFNNKNHRQNLINWLDKRKHSGYTVVGLDDEIQAINNNGAGYKSYQDFENKSNEAMSKAFLGGTMITDDGSSRSQSEVHERNMKAFISARRMWLTYIINEQLIFKMQNLGISIPKGSYFGYVVTEDMTVKEWADVIAILGNMFEMDPQEIQKKIGLELDQRDQIQPTAGPVQDLLNHKKIVDTIDKIYNNGI